MSKETVRSASGPDLGKNRSARDAKHGQSEMLAETGENLFERGERKWGWFQLYLYSCPVQSTCKHFRLMTDKGHFLRWIYLDKGIFLVQQIIHTSLRPSMWYKTINRVT